METAVIRVPRSTKEAIEEIAKRRKSTQAQVVSEAVSEMRRRMLLEAGNEAYARLRANKKAKRAFEEESEAWERLGIADGPGSR